MSTAQDARVAGYFADARVVAAERIQAARERVEALRGYSTDPAEVPSGIAVSFADASMKPAARVDLWACDIPFGDATLLYGDGGIGKGRMLSDLIARVTRGWPMPLCDGDTEPGSVIMIAPEDDATEETAWRLRAAGADLSRVYDLTRLKGGARFKLAADGKHEGDLGQLRALIDELERMGRNPRLVILDPLAALVGWGTISTNQGARRLLEPLQDMARETGVATVVVAHSVKSGVLQGSAGLQQAARLVYRVSRDKDNPAYRVLSVEKGNNVGQVDDVKYTITEDDSTGMVRVVWHDREQLAAQRQSWRDRLATRRSAVTDPVALGCKHASTRFGTAAQCGTCPASGLGGAR